MYITFNEETKEVTQTTTVEVEPNLGTVIAVGDLTLLEDHEIELDGETIGYTQSMPSGLDDLKELAIGTLRHHRLAIQDDSFQYDGIAYDCSERSRGLISGVLQLAQMSPPEWTITWEDTELDQAGFIGLAIALSEHMQAAHSDYKDKKATVEGAGTVDEVYSTTWGIG